MRDLTGLLCLLFIIIAPINFIAYGFRSVNLGGDAINGYQVNGHSYVSDHGRKTEVSESQWYASRRHAVSLWFTSALGLCSILLAIFRDAFPQPIIRSADERAQIVREIRRSGRRQIEFNCSGKFRSINVWFANVAIYPGGIVCEIWGVIEFGISAKEIDNIKREAAFLNTGVTIAHCSPFLGSPISLYFADNKAAMEVLISLAP